MTESKFLKWFMIGVMFCIVATISPKAGYAEAQWTFLVYLDADNDLETYGIADFLEMAAVGSTAEVNIVVQFDRHPGYDSSYGDWTTTKRFLITSSLTPTVANALIDIGEANMGDPATLTDFINWGVANYPANRYALVFWDHGSGWRMQIETLRSALRTATTVDERDRILQDLQRAVPTVYKEICSDYTDGDELYMQEVKNALNAAADMTLIGFDACLMSMTEVAYEIKDTGAAVMVGSEDTEPAEGWPYDTILRDLALNPTWTASQFGVAIVDNYYASYWESETLSAIDLSRMNTLAGVTSTFAETMRNFWNSDQAAVRAAAQAVMDEIDATVLYEQHGDSRSGSYGLAIYFPETQGYFDTNYNGSTIAFPADTFWEEFLSDFYTSMSSSWIADAREYAQQYYVSAHIDLYDFCNKLINPVALDCTNAVPLSSGVAYSGNTTGAPSNISSYGCWIYTLSGPEIVHTITTTIAGDIIATDNNNNLDLVILNACNPSSCVVAGMDSASYTNAPAGTYYIVVDGWNGASGTYTLTVTAPGAEQKSYLLWTK
ncbi:hypothetical protein U27_01760 [Candidatus Vecturithrix granuli]|uniref:Peptidase C11 clostripain n=1 Tax=Vecturithrix granuli TaxID=1499967 RepID=A0A0S6W9J9_VECG1|nr:hypothetical protein U27_01760 [Candidatus Vecturithrix granuli]